MIYAGIDEAGYGPMFGPLVISRSVFAVTSDEYSSSSPPPLWRLLKGAVCKKTADKKKRIAVNDSKKIYNPSAGLRHLERGVLPFVMNAGYKPENMNSLLCALGLDEESYTPCQEWNESKDGSPKLPFAVDTQNILQCAAKLEKNMLYSRVKLENLKAAVIFADRFNRITGSLRSKSGCTWVFVSQHLEDIWNAYGSQTPLVVVDRQGGRRDYLRLLNILFPFADVEETKMDINSRIYDIAFQEKSMKVMFQVDSEKHHLPAALASMTSKYLRELCMLRFQEFWRIHAPDVRPTFGYFGDGRRFLNDISSYIDLLGIDKDKLIRRC
ncbi:MAG: hypothetical protein R6V02_11405 [Candidatus Aminicenantes bacterium]